MNRTICRILSVIVIGTAAALAFADTFPWCVKKAVSIADGFVE